MASLSTAITKIAKESLLPPPPLVHVKKPLSQDTIQTADEIMSQAGSKEEALKLLEQKEKELLESYNTKTTDYKIYSKQKDGLLQAPDKVKYLQDRISRPRSEIGDDVSIESLKGFYNGKALEPLAKYMDTLRSKNWGLKTETRLLDDIVRQTHLPDGSKVTSSHPVDDIVKAMQEAVTKGNEYARSVGNNYKLIDNIKDITHVGNRIKELTEDEYVARVSPMVTNTPEEIKAAYQAAVETDESIANLTFKSADDEIQYQTQLGGDSWTNVISYLEKVSANTAASHVFGSNPRQTFKNLMEDAGLADDSNAYKQMNYEFRNITGTASQVKPNLATQMVTAPIKATTLMLGSVATSTLIDWAGIHQIIRMNDLPYMKTFYQVIKNLASEKNRHQLQQMGFMVEGIISTITNQSRFNPYGEVGSKFDKGISTFLRATGLSVLSDANKQAVNMGFLMKFRDMKGMSWEQVKNNKNIFGGANFFEQLERYGIDEYDWHDITKTIDDADHFMDPTKLDEDVAVKVYRMINEEANRAVVNPGARTQFLTSGLGQQKGTFWHALASASTQFKSSMIEAFLSQFVRAYKSSGIHNKVGACAELLVVATALGGVAYYIDEALKGNIITDPLDSKEGFMAWLSGAVAKGGTIPIASDYIANWIHSDYRDTSSILDKLIGPAVGTTTTNLMDSLYNSVKYEIQGEKRKADKAQAKFAVSVANLSPTKTFWMTKALHKEYVTNFLNELLDPMGAAKKRRKEKSDMKSQGQKKIYDL